MKSKLRQRIVEGPGSIGERARAKRAERFVSTFPDIASMHVLDLGGTLAFWERLSARPASVTAVNLGDGIDLVTENDWFRPIMGDACDVVADFGRPRFDLVFSNSTIEHVGDREARKRFAANVHLRGESHWIQTPNRAFPIEPHVLFPFEQFLPRNARALVARRWPLVHTNATSWESALRSADSTELLSRGEFSRLFPKSEIVDERVAPVIPAKSFVAVLR